MLVVLVRHGETQWNKEEVFRGKIDVGLNENGLWQAEATSEALREWNVGAVYSSPLSRAMETAGSIARPHGLDVRISEGLADFSFGVWEGKSLKQVREEFPDTYSLWEKAPHKVRIPQGETLDEVRGRSLVSLMAVVARHEGEAVVIVSHRAVNKVLLCAVLGLDNSAFWRVPQDTCAINVLEHTKRGWTIRLLNDTCHLKRAGKPVYGLDF